MLSNKEGLPPLNYLWIGPPRPPKTDSWGNVVYGSDVQDVIEMAKKAKNPICYYCLDEHTESFKKVFAEQGVSVKVVSVDTYLKEMKSHSDPQIQKYADKMIKVRHELLKKPRDRIVDRVTFKDAFSLFLLATQGGYTLDTSVKLMDGKTEVTFEAQNHFKCPYSKVIVGFDEYRNEINELVKEPLYESLNECWMMYASPKALEEPRKMLDNYLSSWDHIQDIIRGNEKEIARIMEFHSGITRLMIDSITLGQSLIEETQQRDPNWEYTIDTVEKRGKMKNLSLEKLYGNTHKPQYECREIIKAEVAEYVKKTSAMNSTIRNELLEKLKGALKEYDTEDDLTKIEIINRNINNILVAAKKLDQYTTQLKNVSYNYQSKSNDKTKQEFATQISQKIDAAYGKLTKQLTEELRSEYSTVGNLNSFKKEIDEISQKAQQYHAKKYPLLSWMKTSRFKSDTKLEDKATNAPTLKRNR